MLASIRRGLLVAAALLFAGLPALAMLFSGPAGAAGRQDTNRAASGGVCEAGFLDVPTAHTFHGSIQCLACREVLGGYADGTFRPDADLTRGQVAKIIANAAGYEETYGTARFEDVPAGSPFHQYVERLASRGIVSGYADGTFRPQNDVTRGQVAKFVANAAGYDETYSSAQFADVPLDNPFHQYVERLAARDIVSGYADGTFRPQNNVTRGQVAKFVARTFFPDCQAEATATPSPGATTTPTGPTALAPNKFVGVLYETWMDKYSRHAEYVYPNLPPEDCGVLWWGRPEPGFYRSSDVEVINTHADQLVAAGVDFILIDYSNSNIRDSVTNTPTLKLLNTYLERDKAPKVAFLTSTRYTHGGSNDLEALYNLVYANSAYQQLFLRYGEKPLVLTFDFDGTTGGSCNTSIRIPPAEKAAGDEAAPRCSAIINGRPASDFFECRETRGLLNSGAYWSFLELSPQPVYMSGGWPEQVAVSAAQQVSYMSEPNARGRRWDGSSNGGYEGQNFDAQWARALEVNPTFVLVKSWNEWIAYRLDGNRYTDEFSPEFSNDVEPMTGGHGRFYLDKLARHVAAYKRNSPNLYFYDEREGTWHFKEGRGAERFGAANFTRVYTWPGTVDDTIYQPVLGDFDDDGRTDLGLRDGATGTWRFALADGAGEYPARREFGWEAGSQYQPLVGDFDDDGRTDLGMRNSATGAWLFAHGDGAGGYGSVRDFTWQAGGQYQPVVADFDGDGRTDLGLRDSASGTWQLALAGATGRYSTGLSFRWTAGSRYQPITGDFDCDRKADIALRDAVTGEIALANSDGSGYVEAAGNIYSWREGASYTLLKDPWQCGVGFGKVK